LDSAIKGELTMANNRGIGEPETVKEKLGWYLFIVLMTIGVILMLLLTAGVLVYGVAFVWGEALDAINALGAR
jgi:hypothetical protein